MSEEKHKSGKWAWWTPFAVLALYFLSSVPAMIVTEWLVEAGIVYRGDALDVINTAYAPLLWSRDRSETARDILDRIGAVIIDPLTPHVRD